MPEGQSQSGFISPLPPISSPPSHVPKFEGGDEIKHYEACVYIKNLLFRFITPGLCVSRR